MMMELNQDVGFIMKRVAVSDPCDWYKDAHEMVPTLIGRIHELESVLRRLEWCTKPGLARFNIHCPICERHTGEGHREDCWLGQAIQRYIGEV